MEQMKNKNEYRDGDRLYIDKIKKCICIGHTGDIYHLFCKIIQRGEHDYVYSKDGEYIAKEGNKKLWLLDNSKASVYEAIVKFKETLTRIRQVPGKPITLCDGTISVIYERLSWDKYNYLIQKKLQDGSVTESYHENTSVRNMLFNISWVLDRKYESVRNILRRASNETINDNPVYIAALENNDVVLQYRLKLFYNLVTNEDCLWISKHLGVRILPKLSEEYDKVYVIDVNSISGPDFALLDNSGYEIWHRPYFAMRGCTHLKYEFNPHTKHVLDAAKVDAEAIAFEEYLKLFESETPV